MTWNPIKNWLSPAQHRSPLISLVLPTKNALPHVRTAIEALRRQTYKNFELLVQDGLSTDGTLEYLSSITDLPRVDIVSEQDSGLGQAYNRGIRRCRGELLCLTASDEYLDDDALERGIRWFRKYPQAAMVYGGSRLVDENDEILQVFVPPPFELIGFLKNELFPSSAGFMNKNKIGEELYYDESLKTCPDYDFWIRLTCKFSPAEIVNVREPLMSARGDRTSWSYRAESFDQFCADKRFVLNRFLDSQKPGPLTEAIRRTATAGILTWAAECVFALEGVSPSFLKWCAEAAKVSPPSTRLLRLAERSDAFQIDMITGQMRLNPEVQPDVPSGPTTQVQGIIDLRSINSLPGWKGAFTDKSSTVFRVTTGEAAWSYAAQIPLSLPKRLDSKCWFWAKVRLRVLRGQIGIGVLVGEELLSERMIPARAEPIDVFVKLNRPTASAVIIRNGSLARPSLIEVFSASADSCEKRHKVQELDPEPLSLSRPSPDRLGFK